MPLEYTAVRMTDPVLGYGWYATLSNSNGEILGPFGSEKELHDKMLALERSLKHVTGKSR